MTDKERIAELEKENAELKKELDDGRDAPTIAYLQGASRQNEKLVKAKEIINGLLSLLCGNYWELKYTDKMKRIEEAEAFIKEGK